MSKQFPGGFVSRPQSDPNVYSAPGIWTLDQATDYISKDQWPGLPTDINFKDTSLLVSGSESLRESNNRFFDNGTSKSVFTKTGNIALSSFEPYGNTWSNYFDGDDYAYFNLGSGGAPGTGDFSIDFFVYLTNSSENRGICQLHATSTGLQANSTGTLQVQVFSNNWYYHANNNTQGPYGSAQPNRWYHVILTRKAGTIYFIVNGTALHSFADSTNYSTAIYMAVGGGYASSYLLKGYISNFRYIKAFAPYIGTTYSAPIAPFTTIEPGMVLLTCNTNRFVDSTTNRLVPTVSGAPVVSSFTPFAPSQKYIPNTEIPNSWSVCFDGSLDSLTVPASSNLDLTGDFTTEFWVYPQATSYIICNGTQAGSGCWTFYFNASTRSLTYQMAITTWAGLTLTTPNNTVVQNVWTHVAVTRSGNIFRCFINGTLVATTTNSGGLINTGRVTQVGYYTDSGGTSYFSGYISNLRVVKGTALYTSNFIPTTSALTAIAGTSLLICQSPGIVDNSSNNFTITTAGDVETTKFNPFGNDLMLYGKSVFFDSTGYLTLPSGSLDFMHQGATSWTFECWFYTTTTASAQTLLSTTGSTAQVGFNISAVSSTGKTSVQINRGSSGNDYLVQTNNNVVLPNAWNHLAITFNGTTKAVVIFLNGVQQAITTTGTASFSASGATYSPDIGSFNTASVGRGGYFRGWISNLRVVQNSILYTSNFTPTFAPLETISGTVLLACQSLNYLDRSNNGYQITRNGTTLPIADHFTPFLNRTPSNPEQTGNKSLYFDGTGDYLSVGSTSSFNFLHNSSALFTIEAWVYAPSFASVLHIFGTNAGASANIGTSFFISTSGALRLLIGKGVFAQAVVDITSTGAIPTNKWTHVAVAYDQSLASNNAKFYIDGQLTSTHSKTANAPVATNSTFSGRINASGDTAGPVCYLSNVRVSNSIVYSTNFNPSSVPLSATADTALLIGPTNTIQDTSNNNHIVEVFGNTRVDSLNPFTSNTLPTLSRYDPTGSMYIVDGTGDYISMSNTNLLHVENRAFTLEFWIYPVVATSGNFSGAVFAQGTGAGNQVNFAITNKVPGVLINTAGISVTCNSTHSLVGNSWTHLAFVRTAAGVWTWYANGIPSGTGNLATTDVLRFVSSPAVNIGFNAGGTNLITSYISDLRLVTDAALYTSSFDPPTNRLKTTGPDTRLLMNFYNNNIVDVSTFGMPIETVGNVSVDTAVTKFGFGSLKFDGAGDYLAIPPNIAFQFGTGDFTVEAWIFRTGGSTIFPICQSDVVGSSTNDKWFFAINNTGLIFSTHSTGGFSVTTTTTFTNGIWYHVAAVRESGVMRLFINGVNTTFSTSGTPNGYNLNQNGFAVGAISTPYYWVGNIEDLKVTKGKANYNTTFTPPSIPHLLR